MNAILNAVAPSNVIPTQPCGLEIIPLRKREKTTSKMKGYPGMLMKTKTRFSRRRRFRECL
jgi:hypothetical protein